MKQFVRKTRRLQRYISAVVLSTLGLAGSTHAEDDQRRLDAATEGFKADIQALAQARRGKWVELSTGGSHSREFVQEMERRDKGNAVLVQLRLDYFRPASDGAATEVRTVWLYCEEGTKKTLSTREFDLQGQELSRKDTPDAAVERIESLYAGPEQLICSQQYLIVDLPDGYRRMGDVLALRKRVRAALVADRPIPVR